MHNTKFKNRPVVCPLPALLSRRRQNKGECGCTAPGGSRRGGYVVYINTPPGRLLQHTQHDALAELFRLSLAKGLEGPQPSGARVGP